MKHAFFSIGKCNVIFVDWPLGAIFPYGQATANIRVVGAEIIFLLKKLQQLKNAKLETIHIIGHSLSAHAGGYVGKALKNLGRITGLDPAGPYFQEVSPEVRLDASDAIFVDVIHSNAGKTILQDLSAGCRDKA
ncbi:pancreatic lipase-related protein 2-like [Centruroides vittatus]|uniref:pancreatic lipase-related protein 2-like n=1 Tax=Centruroides vittatus TaxID=120091 RepID=UPI00350EB571